MGANFHRPDEAKPEHYGVDPARIVAIMIHGTPIDPATTYPMDLYHVECADDALALYQSPSWYLVRAGNLDWRRPYHCIVCEESVT